MSVYLYCDLFVVVKWKRGILGERTHFHQKKFSTLLFTSLYNSLYSGGLTHCYILDESVCPFRGVRSILAPLFYFDGFGWLVGCFGLNSPLKQYFSLYQAISQREGERKEK